LLLQLYPAEFRRVFGAQMEQTFKDQYRDALAQRGRLGLGFWLAVLGDAALGILCEHWAARREERAGMKRWDWIAAALIIALICLGWFSQGPGHVMSFVFAVAPLLTLVLVLVWTLARLLSRLPAPAAPDRRAWVRYGLGFGAIWLAVMVGYQLIGMFGPTL